MDYLGFMILSIRILVKYITKNLCLTNNCEHRGQNADT